MIKTGDTRVKLLSSTGQWYGVTYPDDKPRVVDALAAMHDGTRYPTKLWE